MPFLTQKTTIIIPLLLAVSFLFIGAGCTKNQSVKPKRTTLSYWRVFDDSSVMQPIISAYQSLHPSVSISYKKMRIEEYERELLEGFAEDRGPDIFSIPNTSVGKYETKLVPLPSQIEKIPTAVPQGGNKEPIIQYQSKKAPDPRILKDTFVPTVFKDVIKNEHIYGLPLFVDTLALFYNRDLLARAGIPEPPRTWGEVQDAVQRLTVIAEDGSFLQSGIAIGTAENVSRSPDVLALLMMQSGITIVDDTGSRVLLSSSQDSTDNLSANALLFYTDFANPTKTVYTWNDTQSDAVTAFSQGKVAMMLGYSYHLPQIRQKNPNINMGVTAIPQITASEMIPVNVANYWIEVVAKKTAHPNIAWDFILFATRQEQAMKYLESTKRPTALRSLIRQQQEDLDLKPFVDGLLVTKSWYKGNDPNRADEALKEAITVTLEGSQPADAAITLAGRKIQETLK
ncbi:MAG: CUT1 family carbohydrate ABC transporter, TC 3.A.1.1.-, substrate-binding protein [Parcubacteria group bacterium GW2011_GWA2_43_13]|nr:MAG: CUT1 family carbohydrate ABC transporter, TC 3.A.1.1.-, substrate-binding protein [Parcubacteria group bacterium GW2011_GWA2_43_13]OGY69881.1 MAG: hypothetical protein A3B94_02680 [Candidatus Jacksonbacteria bacterium RIFCSPHIGHO2_02_FULL_43_10]OGY71264.1 MAG: hypothetical protein A2986_04100 [Candidatus Jacksonbacteria bacterium RIFCSPLOWO2_01_FULL_44_13]HAZ16732.1 hypothetical protein [Candidatus Jacksonbacteria bacterium]